MKLFESDTPQNLYRLVIDRIYREQRARMRRNVYTSLVGTLCSLVLSVYASVWLYNDMKQSGFLQSFGLLFSDSSIVFRYWQDFSSLLVEALPFMSLVVCLGAVAAVIISIRSLYKNIYHEFRFS